MGGRIRTIKPELLTDEKTATLSAGRWRLFVSLLSAADDYGAFRANTAFLIGQLFWGAPDQPTPEELTADLKALHDCKLLQLYSVRGQLYGVITNWTKHQKIDKPGRPQCPTIEDHEAKPLATTVRESFANPSRIPREPLATDLDLDLDLDLEKSPSPARNKPGADNDTGLATSTVSEQGLVGASENPPPEKNPPSENPPASDEKQNSAPEKNPPRCDLQKLQNTWLKRVQLLEHNLNEVAYLCESAARLESPPANPDEYADRAIAAFVNWVDVECRPGRKPRKSALKFGEHFALIQELVAGKRKPVPYQEQDRRGSWRQPAPVEQIRPQPPTLDEIRRARAREKY